MSRSRRKTPIVRGSSRGSDKWWRRKYNRKLRRANKVRLQQQGEDFLPKLVREVSNVWDGQRDHTWDFRDYKHGMITVWYPRFWAEREGITVEEYIAKEREEAKEEYRKYMRK